MLCSRQTQKLGLFGLLLALSLAHVSAPAQAAESGGSEIAGRGFEQGAQGPLDIALLSLAVALPTIPSRTAHVRATHAHAATATPRGAT